MGMKLLKKSEVNTAKAQDRAREIQEGVKLAKRVDSLRETQANEEANLERFRKETIASINEEIVALTREKNVLIKDVSDLEDRKRIALLPLNAEWEEVNLKKDELTQYALSLNEDRLIFEEEKKSYEVEVELLETEKKRVSRERNQSIKSLAKAEEQREESRKLTQETQEIKDSMLKLKESVTNELKERDLISASKERDLENLEKRLQKYNKSLDLREKRLIDREQTLERNIKRLK